MPKSAPKPEDMADYLEEQKQAAIAEMGGGDDKVAPVVDEIPAAVAVEPVAPVDPTKAAAAVDTKKEEDDAAAVAAATAEEAKIEEDLEGELDDYLPPADYAPKDEEKTPAGRQAAPEESIETAPAPVSAEMQALMDENAYMRKQAELLEVDLSPPKLEMTPEILREMEDTSPEVARFATAMMYNMDQMNKKMGEKFPAAAAPQESKAERQRKADAAQNHAIKQVPELDYWFNYPTPEGENEPAKITRARKMAGDMDAELLKDPNYADRNVRYIEVAKRVKEEIKRNIEKRGVERTTKSMSAAPGSDSEGSAIERLKNLPATEMRAALDKLPVDQQRAARREIFG